MASAADTEVTLDPQRDRLVITASSLGTVFEWYDFFLYGTAAALVFNRLFFPQLDPLTGTLASFASSAVGFFARPFGGIIFGHFGDRLGRKSTLVATLVMMGAATCLVGVLPTYEQIGLWAPALLVLLRVVQGIAVGGEWGGAVLTHAGSNSKWYCVAWLAPERGFAVLAAVNQGGDRAQRACDEACSTLLRTIEAAKAASPALAAPQ